MSQTQNKLNSLADKYVILEKEHLAYLERERNMFGDNDKFKALLVTLEEENKVIRGHAAKYEQ